jgi:hypothetical protein
MDRSEERATHTWKNVLISNDEINANNALWTKSPHCALLAALNLDGSKQSHLALRLLRREHP